MNLFKTKAGSSTAQESDERKLSAPLCVRDVYRNSSMSNRPDISPHSGLINPDNTDA